MASRSQGGGNGYLWGVSHASCNLRDEVNEAVCNGLPARTAVHLVATLGTTTRPWEER